MRSTRRLVATILFVVLAIPIQGHASQSTSITRVRFSFTSSSDWARVEVLNVTELTKAIVSANGISKPVGFGAASFTVHTTKQAVVAVDYIFDVPPPNTPVVRVTKGHIGSTSLTVTRRNAPNENVAIASATNTNPSGDANAVLTPVLPTDMVGSGLVMTYKDPRRLVLGFYHPWFSTDTFSQGTWQDTPSGAYDTKNQGAVSAMMAEAKGAGVNGWVVSWTDKDYSTRVDMVMAEARKRGDFSIAAHVEALGTLTESKTSTVSGPVLERWIRNLAPRFSDPAYLKVGTRPVIFIFGTWKLAPSVWRTVLANLRKSNIDPFTIGGSTDDAYGFDGAYFYSPNDTATDALRDRYIRWLTTTRLRSMVDPTTRQMLWAAPVSPGHDNSHAHPNDALKQPRVAGTRYDATWSGAMASDPEWTLICSWNEWFEQTHISPGANTGPQALEQTRTWSKRFRGASVL